MRAVPALLALCLAGPALAGSIEMVKSLPPGGAEASVTRVACPTCPALQPKKSTYPVPVLAKGKQTVELRTVSGEQKIYRTDAWLGGSPVVFVSTPTPEMIAALTPRPAVGPDPAKDGIDRTKTAAVDVAFPPLLAKAPVAAAIAPATLDTSGFSLRTN